MAFPLKKVMLVLFVASIVVTSGCVETNNEEDSKSGQGLEVISFQAVPSEVFSEDSFDVSLEVQNKGGREAEDVRANLYSLSGATPGGDTFKSGNLDLSAPTEDFGGERAILDWSLEAPEVPSGMEDTIKPTARIFYKYDTISRINIPAMSKSEHKRRLSSDSEIPEISTARVTPGPFSIDVQGPSPARVEDGDEEFHFYVHGTNLLDGVPYKVDAHPDEEGELGNEDTNVIEADIEMQGADITNNCDGEDVNVIGGDSFQLNCKAEVDDVKPVQEIPVQITLDYGYYITDETSVKVRGE